MMKSVFTFLLFTIALFSACTKEYAGIEELDEQLV
ncbi:MAG: hypothetical protein RLZ47_1413, partial [Bacteroidota bacterium]